jgi:hypothetical protein
VDYSNENTERIISILEGCNMELDDGSQWHFSIQPPPSNWETSDSVTVEKEGRMMYKVVHLTKKNDGSATMMRDAADEYKKDVSKSCAVPVIDQELSIVSIDSRNLIKLSYGPDYRPGGINLAKVDLRFWKPGDTIKIVSNKTRFGLYEMINTKRQNQSIDVIKAE